MYGKGIGLALPRLVLLAAIVVVGVMAVACAGSSDSANTTSAGLAHTCGVRADGNVKCSGYDEFGQPRSPGGEFQSVSAGWFHTCGVRADGNVKC